MSNWCNANKWFKDDLFTIPNKSIPINEINDAIVNKNTYNFLISKNTCFQKIPYFQAYNLNIVNDTNTKSQTQFTCGILSTNDVYVDTNILLKHWENNTHCTYEMSSISLSSGTILDKVICQTNPVSGTGFYSRGSTIDSCLIISQSLYLGPGSIIKCTNSDFPTRIATDSGVCSNISTDFATNTILAGKFYIDTNSNIDCSGIGDFFLNNSTIGPNGHIEGTVILSSGSINKGKIFGDNIIFSGIGTTNLGLVSGNCIFIHGASNIGNISGSASFRGIGSNNYGSIDNEAYFYDNAINQGIVNNVSFFYDSQNLGTLNNGAKFYNSINGSGIIKSGEVLLNNSQNDTIICGSIVNFISGSINRTNGIVYSDNIMLNSGINTGGLYAESGLVEFKNYSINSGYGYCQAKNIIFKDFSSNLNFAKLDSVSGSLFIFTDKSINYGFIDIKTDDSKLNFINKSINLGALSVSGSGSSINFYNNAINFANINFVNFYNSSINSGIITTGLFYNKSINLTQGTDLYFCDQSANASGNHTPLSCTFRDQSTNSGSITSSFFYNNSYNNPPSSISLSIQSGTFFDSAQNGRQAKFTSVLHFYNNSLNLASNNINHYFYNQSTNNGKCSGTAYFYNKAKNINYVNIGLFFNNSTNEKLGSGYSFSFNDKSSNRGYCIEATFTSGSVNEGSAYISGALFDGYSINRSSFTINNKPIIDSSDFQGYGYDQYPIVKFKNNSKNLANIVDSLLEFQDNSINLGSVNFGTIYSFSGNNVYIKTLIDNKIKFIPMYDSTDLTKNSEKIFLEIFYACPPEKSWPNIYFRDNSINSGNIYGYKQCHFYDSSENYGDLSYFPIVPNELHDIAYFSESKNFGNITRGKSYFFNNALNSGIVAYPRFDNSINYGNIIGAKTDPVYLGIRCDPSPEIFDTVSFDNSINYGNINNINCNFFYSTNFGNIAKKANFLQSANFGFIGDDAEFTSASYNYGNIGGNASFINSHCASCDIRGFATFNHSNYYSYSFLSSATDSNIYESVILYDIRSHLISVYGGDSTWSQILQLLKFKEQNLFKYSTFTNSSNNYGGTILSSALFDNLSINNGNIKNNATFIRDSKNSGNITLFGKYGTVEGNCEFISNSHNYSGNILGNATFNIGCNNNYGNIEGLGIFYSSINKGNIASNAVFFDSQHYGNIGGSAIFSGNSYFKAGAIENNAEFYNSYSSNDTYIGKNASFFGWSYNDGYIAGGALFCGSGANNPLPHAHNHINGYVAGDAVFDSGGYNFGIIKGSATYLTGNYNCGYIYGPIISTTPIGCNASNFYTEQQALFIINRYSSPSYLSSYIDSIKNWERVAQQNN